MDQSAFLLKEVLQWTCQQAGHAPFLNFPAIANRHPSISEPNKLAVRLGKTQIATALQIEKMSPQVTRLFAAQRLHCNPLRTMVVEASSIFQLATHGLRS
jgi:hypothetical protein